MASDSLLSMSDGFFPRASLRPRFAAKVICHALSWLVCCPHAANAGHVSTRSRSTRASNSPALGFSPRAPPDSGASAVDALAEPATAGAVMSAERSGRVILTSRKRSQHSSCLHHSVTFDGEDAEAAPVGHGVAEDGNDCGEHGFSGGAGVVIGWKIRTIGKGRAENHPTSRSQTRLAALEPALRSVMGFNPLPRGARLRLAIHRL